MREAVSFRSELCQSSSILSAITRYFLGKKILALHSLHPGGTLPTPGERGYMWP